MKVLPAPTSPLGHQLRRRLEAEARVRELRAEEAKILAAFPELRRRPRTADRYHANHRRPTVQAIGRLTDIPPQNDTGMQDLCWVPVPRGRRPM